MYGPAKVIVALYFPVSRYYSLTGLVTSIQPLQAFLYKNDPTERYIPFALNIFDVLRSVILLATRGFGLYKTLKAKHPVSIDWHFATFCSVYNYLVYFHRVLRLIRPKL